MNGRRSTGGARRVWLWWTAGKDSAWNHHVLRDDPSWRVEGLVTPLNQANGRVAMHGVRQGLVEAQAATLGLALRSIEYDWKGPSKSYEEAVKRVLGRLARDGAEAIAFPDLSSRRVRGRRTGLAEGTGLEPVFALWGRDSKSHAAELISSGLSAWVCSVQTADVSPHLVGRRYDASFIADLEPHVDVCGEDGEFHTFVEWAPGWTRRVTVEPTRSVERYGLAFAELMTARERRAAVYEGRLAVAELRRDIEPFEYFDRLGRVRSYVDAHLGEELNTAAAARVAAMSPPAFRRYFRQHVGESFRTWLGRRRVERACQMLREHNLPVSRVGEEVGFGTQRSFRRVFRLHMGRSPVQYKKEFIAASEDAARSLRDPNGDSGS